jgi:ABC-2 type transport system permease protein
MITEAPVRVLDLRVLQVEVAEGLRAIVREPTALFFSVLFPVMFFALFASLFGDQPSPSGIPTAAAMVISALPYALAVLLAISAVSLFVVGPVLDLGTWLRRVGVLLLGGLPFALLGLAVGFVASSNATAAVLNAVYLPMVVGSGLWFPLEMMPGFVRAIAPFLPTYHLAQLALAQLTGAGASGNLLALLLTTAISGGLAAWAYRNFRI